MTEEKVEVILDGLARLQTAALDFARTEIERIADAVIDELKSRSAPGYFGNIAARHMWDEYCWALQKGPFDTLGWDQVRLGSLSGTWDMTIRAFIDAEVEKLPEHALIFVSAQAFEDAEREEDVSIGVIWVEGIVTTVVSEIDDRAGQRNLDLIGPYRADVIGHEVSGSGVVWSALSGRGEAANVIAAHAGEMIDPDADLSVAASEMTEAFLAAAVEETEGTAAAEFLRCFANEIRALLIEKDVIPALERMRRALTKRLDG